MAKPATFDGYSDRYTVDCERVLVTLLRDLGPWKESVFLVGGLTPRACRADFGFWRWSLQYPSRFAVHLR